jgi:hypothetical protein
MDKRKDKKSSSTDRVADINIRKTKTNERMGVDIDPNKNVKALAELKLELDEAAKINPCPGCKHDTEQLAKFISAKLDSARSGSSMDREMIKSLREVDYINELTDIAIGFSKFIKPFTRISKVPEVYEKVLHDDMEANKKVKEHLLKASELTKEFEGTDKQFKIVSDVLKAFIRATDFKLSVDPYTFYLFDRTIKLGYKTHLLSATSKVIVGIKGIVDPSRYK